MGRDSHLKKIFGNEKLLKIQSSKVVMIGAGGIGCELLKNLIMMNYGEIHIVDLDTIDLSNLNRQFLFRQKDIKKSKSLTALKAVEFFNNDKTKLYSYDGSIMDTQTFPLSWFEQFDIIFNALDNIEARTYVNRIALFLQKPLMESGTTGFKGQVQPIYPYKSECFECITKETPKTFPVCTIRSTPSKPIHCITWAKNFLFLQLFGEETEELQLKDLNSDDQAEVELLLKESNELLDLKKMIINAKDISNDKTFVYKIIDKIFKTDIERLLKIETLWKTRTKPVPLDYHQYEIQPFDIDDQQVWTVLENLSVLVDSTIGLTKRYQITRNIEFDKDDNDTLDFVVAASNLRSQIFGIPTKSKFDIKQIAGNIIPAIATTNAIIAGFSALQSLKCFESDPYQKSHLIFTSDYNDKFISLSSLLPKRSTCKSCSILRGVLRINSESTLEHLVNELKEKYNYEEISMILGKNRLIYDYDFDDNLSKQISELGFYDGEIMLINDEDDVLESCEFYIQVTDENKLVLPNLNIPEKKTEEPEQESDDEEIITIENDDDIVQIESSENIKRKIEDDEMVSEVKKAKLGDDSIIID